MKESTISGDLSNLTILLIIVTSLTIFISITCIPVFASQHHTTVAEKVTTSNAHEGEAEKKINSVEEKVQHQNVQNHEAGANGKQETSMEENTSNENHGKTAVEHSGSAEKETAKEIEEPEEPEVTGSRFAEASVEVLKKELNSFWGWRPNDYITFFTDNRKNFQLGVLEVSRRAAVELSERISRTGSTAALNKNLEEARNLLMVKADAYMFPSAGFSYSDAVEDIEKYREQLIKGHASFFTRTDNLIPLLQRFEDLLGSCDENLVKQTEDDGTTVSTFAADDYFYYAQGVASAMVPIFEAISEDFHETISSRLSIPTLNHIIHSCEEAADLHPWMVFNGDLDGIIANHRANMATFISHARFYVGVLIKTLST